MKKRNLLLTIGIAGFLASSLVGRKFDLGDQIEMENLTASATEMATEITLAGRFGLDIGTLEKPTMAASSRQYKGEEELSRLYADHFGRVFFDLYPFGSLDVVGEYGLQTRNLTFIPEQDLVKFKGAFEYLLQQ